jgi:GNAT superfamily N-acetyltransferase
MGQVSTVSLPSPAPNEALEATGHSAGFCLSSWVGGAVARASAWALDGEIIPSRGVISMLCQHPRLLEIHRYTARRLACSLDDLTSSGTKIITAEPNADPRLPQTNAAHDPHIVAIFRLGNTALVRTHRQPSQAVAQALQGLPTQQTIEPHDVLTLSHVQVSRHGPTDYYFYLDPARFCPRVSAAIRQLTSEDRALMVGLQAVLPPPQRWYVEIDHPIVFGYVVEQRLVAVASHFLFEADHIAAAGVLTHPDFRRRGWGKVVSSAVVQWAIDRQWIVEWSTTATNLGSLGIANGLGFSEYATETELRITAA